MKNLNTYIKNLIMVLSLLISGMAWASFEHNFPIPINDQFEGSILLPQHLEEILLNDDVILETHNIQHDNLPTVWPYEDDMLIGIPAAITSADGGDDYLPIAFDDFNPSEVQVGFSQSVVF